ncbi:MAG: hypothetical protein NC900_05355 [Candidatus Omnitrophica bacterium]|nr:hypothetical protein [Candidatus Omnitrophota bacterium]MCM8800133.1 hypothetical protein [Candidatus Omnitrophota bacterium]
MNTLSKILVILGFFLIIWALVLRVGLIPFLISTKPIKPSSLLILANSCFILAVFFKK